MSTKSIFVAIGDNNNRVEESACLNKHLNAFRLYCQNNAML